MRQSVTTLGWPASRDQREHGLAEHAPRTEPAVLGQHGREAEERRRRAAA